MADSIIGKISVGDGATFTPDVTDGVLSFTNNKNLPNPEPYNIAAKVLDEGENELRTLVTAAETAAGNAATSETNAHNSEQAAKASQAAAKTSEQNAKTSESNAAASKQAAATSASNAKASETNAANSKTAAATSASNAATSATAAAASAAEVEAALDDYLPLSGGTVTGGLTVEGTITGNLAGNATNATNATNDANGSPIASTYLPLSGGTMTGSIQYVENGKVFSIENTGIGAVDLGWSYDNREGAGLELRSTDHSNPGEFILFARGANNTCYLTGMPDGSLTWNGQPLLPVGIVQAFAGTTIPNGWLLCDGSAVSRTTYAKLFSVIGTTYGRGNGSTTFNLPNLVDKFVEGSATAGTVKSAGLPNITGSIGLWMWMVQDGEGAFSPFNKNNPKPGTAYNGDGWAGANFDASHSNSIYGNSTTVQPPALTMRYIIKY